jgi:hypothetical protein
MENKRTLGVFEFESSGNFTAQRQSCGLHVTSVLMVKLFGELFSPNLANECHGLS